MELSKNHFWHLLFYFFNKNKIPIDCHRSLVKIYGEYSPSIKTYKHWFRQFRSNDFDVSDKECLGQKNLRMQNCKNYWTKTQLNSLQK